LERGFDDGCSVRLSLQEYLRCDKLLPDSPPVKSLRGLPKHRQREGRDRWSWLSAASAENHSHVQRRSIVNDWMRH
jgi:hypothetical protein